MKNLMTSTEKQKLTMTGYVLLAVNVVSYLCLTFIAKCLIDYDLFNKSIQLDTTLLFLPLASCLLVLILTAGYYFWDIKAEPIFEIFKTTVKLDYYLRLSVVIITVVLIKTTINSSNELYLYMGIGIIFCINLFLESSVIKIIKKTSDAKIDYIKKSKFIKLTAEEANEYKEAMKSAKKSFIVMMCVFPFNFVLKSTFFTAIFFIIYSIVMLFLLKKTYFLVFKEREAVFKLFIRYLILVCGFVFVLLLNEKIIVITIYKFSPQELISLIGIFTIPLYRPVRYVYIALKRSDNFN